ncbi:MAG: hypothetical protein KBT04_03040 [Bacteroidales bacterium]|nr:hypothetical protein [Candidatus Colimorpha onthohippi]
MPENKARYVEGEGWRCDADITRHHRESLWDYKGRAIYHVTIATERRQPIFGTLIGNSEDEAFIVYSRLGEYVDRTFRGLPEFYRQKGVIIKVLAVRVMPDHLHGVIHVIEPMPKGIGEIVRSFKSACTSWFKREYFGKNAEEMQKQAEGMQKQTEEVQKQAEEVQKQAEDVHKQAEEMQKQSEEMQKQSEEVQKQAEEVRQKLEGRLVQFCRIFATGGSIWEYMPVGYHERILHCEGQLDRMIRYVKDNPRRLWLKHHNPDLFKLRNKLCWSFEDENGTTHTWRFRFLGNMFLMEFPHKQHIQCSRSITTDQLELYSQKWIRNAQQGMVSITSAISEGEKTVTKRLREAGMPLIVMLKEGFPPEGSSHERYYKPGGVYFDACAAGRLLLIEPYSEVLDDPVIVEAVHRKSPMAKRESMRYHFLALNKIGEIMSFGKNAEEMQKQGEDAERV